ncbi:hypothetical protein M426DRAFT_323793 [Hypoxylon sp. CI-4A]|nr:hypothetical protein M426DRAFT_323793 [Hypoxylon sp. CI-4A]
MTCYPAAERVNFHSSQPTSQHDSSRQSTTRNSKIPPEDYEDFVLHGQRGTYRVESLCWDDGDLIIYQITSGFGKRLQAQQFELCRLPKHLYSSRKRRIYRLRKAQKIVDTIELGGVRIFVTPVPEDSSENWQSSRSITSNAEKWPAFSIEDFPSLCPPKWKYAHKHPSSVCSDSSSSD